MTPGEQQALVRATLQIFHNWKVEDAEACRILGLEDVGQIVGLRAGAFIEIPDDTLDRMALILTIHTSLRIWFRDPARGYEWMRRQNLVFDNLSPVELIKARAGLHRLKLYLDASIQAG